MSETSPTVEFYAGLQRAFDHFNSQLFDGKLPPCLITLRSSSRHYGYHQKDRFVSRNGKTLDELGLHPGFFTLRPVEEVLSTLVHEMVHHWQDCFGRPSKSNPHNREWSAMMRDVGLEPSSTGLPQGKDTGQTVSHFILPNGRFIKSCQELLKTGFKLEWFDRHVPRPSREHQQGAKERHEVLTAAGLVVELSPPAILELNPTQGGKSPLVEPPVKRDVDRVKYVCGICGMKAWSVSSVRILCGHCNVELKSS